jgi:hypothetical protein
MRVFIAGAMPMVMPVLRVIAHAMAAPMFVLVIHFVAPGRHPMLSLRGDFLLISINWDMAWWTTMRLPKCDGVIAATSLVSAPASRGERIMLTPFDHTTCRSDAARTRRSHATVAAVHSRRAFLSLLLLAPLPVAFGATGTIKGSKATTVEIWKEKTCGCCGDWIKHLEANGFEVTTHDTGNTAMRARLGIPVEFGSCHTALIDGYAIEGHVPAGDIRRLLRERPQAVGLAVPGMPVGSPGMDGPAYKGRKDPYEVLLVLRDGRTQTFQVHR